MSMHAQDREFVVGTRILAKDVEDSSWNLRIVVARCRPLSLVVKLDSGTDCSSTRRPSQEVKVKQR